MVSQDKDRSRERQSTSGTQKWENSFFCSPLWKAAKIKGKVQCRPPLSISISLSISLLPTTPFEISDHLFLSLFPCLYLYILCRLYLRPPLSISISISLVVDPLYSLRETDQTISDELTISVG